MKCIAKYLCFFAKSRLLPPTHQLSRYLEDGDVGAGFNIRGDRGSATVHLKSTFHSPFHPTIRALFRASLAA